MLETPCNIGYKEYMIYCVFIRIDQLLRGGLRAGQLIELVGPSSSGKTQVSTALNFGHLVDNCRWWKNQYGVVSLAFTLHSCLFKCNVCLKFKIWFEMAIQKPAVYVININIIRHGKTTL